MRTLPVGEFKSHFSELLKAVQAGEEIIITYGKNKNSVAALIPISEYKQKNKIKIGLLKNTKIEITEYFDMTEEELLGL